MAGASPRPYLHPVIALLLALQQAPADTAAYSTPALRALVARAADSNAVFPARSFRAHFESEIAVNKALPNRVEGISSVEQYAGTLTWSGRQREPAQPGLPHRHDRASVAGRLRARDRPGSPRTCTATGSRC